MHFLLSENLISNTLKNVLRLLLLKAESPKLVWNGYETCRYSRKLEVTLIVFFIRCGIWTQKLGKITSLFESSPSSLSKIDKLNIWKSHSTDLWRALAGLVWSELWLPALSGPAAPGPAQAADRISRQIPKLTGLVSSYVGIRPNSTRITGWSVRLRQSYTF